MEWNEIKHFLLFSSLLKLASVEVSLVLYPDPVYDEVLLAMAVDEVYLRAASL